MPRLIAVDLRGGLRMTLQGVPYQITEVIRGHSAVTVAPARNLTDGKPMTRNELYAALVSEKAKLEDDLLDADEEGEVRAITDISHMSLLRIVEWQAKLFIFKRMICLSGASPRSTRFREALKEATSEVEAWRAKVGYPLNESWAPHTFYNLILRWRRCGNQLAALQSKGVEYRPWDPKKRHMAGVAELAREIALEMPNASAATIHRETQKRLNANGGL